jgi:UTP-glucose-1-phosphate uridylyltransferase
MANLQNLIKEKTNNYPALVVLAAGMGSRYGGLKQIDPVGPSGEAVLDYSVFDARRAGFSKVVFVIRRDIEEAFRKAIGSRFEKQIDVRYVFQHLDMLPPGFAVPPDRQKPWGTGQALLCSAPEVNEPLAAINADDFYGTESFRVMADFLRDPATISQHPPVYSMVGFRLKTTLSEHGTVARGLCQTDKESFLTSVEELTAIEKTANGARNKEPDGSFRTLTGEEIVSMNFWGFTPSIFPHLKELFAEFLRDNQNKPKAEFYIPYAVNLLLQRRQAAVKVLPTPSEWFGVTYREDRPLVVESIQNLVRAGKYPAKLWA